jgi:cytoskeletal protein CcmA (bactofilin family)
MWGSKKVETEAPLSAIPGPPQGQETNPSKVISAPLEDKSMNTETIRPATTAQSGATNRLGAGLHIKGEISGREDLQVDGSVEGVIRLEKGKLTVGASARIVADINATEIVVYGSVKGNLNAPNRIEIRKEGSVIGDLTTARIMIEDGANFKGAIEIDHKAADRCSEKPVQAFTAPVSVPATMAS